MFSVLLRRRKLGRGSCNGIADASTTGIKVVRNWVERDWEGLGGIADPLIVFRWGCTSSLPDAPGNPAAVVNLAQAIHWCGDKKQSRLDMQEAGVPVPQTWDVSEFLSDLVGDHGEFVLRRDRHAQGRDLWHGTVDDIRRAMERNDVTAGYVSAYISKVAEYRVMVVQNRVAWVAQKTPGNPEAVAWNVAQGGRFDNVRWGAWPARVVQAALHAAEVSGTDFCGVDVMVDAEGSPYVLEVNSAPSQTSPYRQQCLAKCFDYIVERGKEQFPRASVPDWRSVIHPAVLGEN